MRYLSKQIPKKAKIVSNHIKLNFPLLESLLKFEAPGESASQDYFLSWITAGIRKTYPEIITVTDKYGNLYIQKGEADLYPCVVAHVDTAQDYKGELMIFNTGDKIFGFDNKEGVQCGIGADDRCGVYFALEMLKHFDNIKVFLSKDEEIGALGTKASDITWFKDCSLLIQLDRRSYTNDVIQYTNGVEVLSKEFKDVVKPLMKKYKYEFNDGTFTDIGELKKKGADCIAMNISVGYLNEHCEDEIILVNHFVNALNFGHDIIKQFGSKKWEHISKVSQTTGFSKKFMDKWDIGAYDDYLLNDRPQDVGTWHHCYDWRFTKEDEDYIQDCIETGQCPMCNSTTNDILTEGEFHCYDCQSTFNIPIGKMIEEIEEEVIGHYESNFTKTLTKRLREEEDK